MDDVKLTAQRVEYIFGDCLFSHEEAQDPQRCMDKAVIVRGIVLDAGFNPERLKKHKAEIHRLINQLPKSFGLDTGQSFTSLCEDQHGRQWADLHKTCQELLLLGLAIGRMRYVQPKEVWARCYGGVPDVQVLPLPQ